MEVRPVLLLPIIPHEPIRTYLRLKYSKIMSRFKLISNSSASSKFPLGREVFPDSRKCNREAQEGSKRSAEADWIRRLSHQDLFDLRNKEKKNKSRKGAETQRPPADRQEAKSG